MSFGTFKYFPFLSVSTEVSVVLLLLSLVYIALRRMMRFTEYEAYVLFLVVAISSIASIRAFQVFGQPVGIGLLQQRVMATCLISLLLIHAVRIRWISLEEIRVALLFYAWSCLALFVCMEIFLNPASFANIPGFIQGGIVEPFAFVFDPTPLAFGYFLYLATAARSRRLYDVLRALVFALGFLSFIVFVQGGRSFFLSTIVVTAAYVAFRVRLVGLIGWAVAFILVLSGAYLFPDVFLMEEIASYRERLRQAIEVVSTGEYGEDASANARINEIGLALPYLREHWLMGSGSLSVTWNQGWDGVVGAFRPSDIGIVGNIFVLGIVGTSIIYAQCLFALRYIRLVSRRNVDSSFTSGLALAFAGIVIHSFTTGKLFYYPAVSVFLISVLYVASQMRPGTSIRQPQKAS